MKDDLENTRALNELEELKEDKENIEIVDIPDDINETSQEELYDNLTQNDTKEENIDIIDVKNKFSFSKWFKELSKKNKIIFISSIVLVLVLIILILFLVLKPKKEEETPVVPDVIVEKDNYVYQNGTLQILDENDKVIGTYECTNKDEELCFVAYLNNDEDKFDIAINKREDDEIIKSRSRVVNDRFVFIVDQVASSNDIVTLYDLKENKALGDYLGVKQYNVDREVAILKNKEDKYALIEFSDMDYTTLMDFQYKYLGLINKQNDNLVVGLNNNGYYLFDYNGNIKTKVIPGEIVDYNDNYIVSINNNKYTVYNYTGEVFNDKYDYIKLINDNYVAVVSGADLFIRGYSDNKYNEDGIGLNNKDYRRVNTYDEDNKLVTSSYAFTYELNNNILTVNVYNNNDTASTFTINLLEGEASTKYSHVSYFNGELYFYSDDEKKELIGSYECKNQNTVTSDIFNNCYVAKDSSFNDTYVNPPRKVNATIPIYNNRYVFIFDAPDLQNEDNIEIKFYDLKENKVLNNYSMIDSNTNDNNGELQLASGDFKILAKAKNGKYGVIEIAPSGAKVLVKFDYNYIERFKDNYEILNDDNKWQIYVSDNEISHAFDGKIMNYVKKHYVIRNNDKVNLYKGTGEKVETETNDFLYIELINDLYFAGVDKDNQLNVYKLEDGKKYSTNVGLPTSVFYGTDNPSYKNLTIGSDSGSVEVYTGSAYEKKTFDILKEEKKEDSKEEEKQEEKKDEKKENEEGKIDEGSE